MKRTFAQRAKRIQSKYPNFERSKMEKDSMMQELQKLADEQEAYKAQNNIASDGNTFTPGGPTAPTSPDISTINSGVGLTYQQAYDLAVAVGDPFPDVTAGQYALESGWGKSSLSEPGKNNFFGIKWTEGAARRIEEATGIKVRKGTPKADNQPGKIKPGTNLHASYMEFDSPLDGFKAHKAFLETNSRYKEALKADNAEDFIRGIAKAGYAEAGQYDNSVLNIMKQNGGIEEPSKLKVDGNYKGELFNPRKSLAGEIEKDSFGEPIAEEEELEIDTTGEYTDLLSPQAAGPEPIDSFETATRMQQENPYETTTEAAQPWVFNPDENNQENVIGYKQAIINSDGDYQSYKDFSDHNPLRQWNRGSESINSITKNIMQDSSLTMPQKKELLDYMEKAYDYRDANDGKKGNPEEIADYIETKTTPGGRYKRNTANNIWYGVEDDLDTWSASQESAASIDDARAGMMGPFLGNVQAGGSIPKAGSGEALRQLRDRAHRLLTGKDYQKFSHAEKQQVLHDLGIVYNYIKSTGDTSPDPEKIGNYLNENRDLESPFTLDEMTSYDASLSPAYRGEFDNSLIEGANLIYEGENREAPPLVPDEVPDPGLDFIEDEPMPSMTDAFGIGAGQGKQGLAYGPDGNFDYSQRMGMETNTDVPLLDVPTGEEPGAPQAKEVNMPEYKKPTALGKAASRVGTALQGVGDWAGRNDYKLAALAGAIPSIATNVMNRRSLKNPALLEPEIVRPSVKARWYDRSGMDAILSNQLASARTSLANRGGNVDDYLTSLRAVNFDGATARGQAEVEGQKINMAEQARVDAAISRANEMNAQNLTQARIDQAQRQDNVDAQRREYLTGIGQNVSGVFSDISDAMLAERLAPMYGNQAALQGAINAQKNR
jgi:flagellum-specific peptidoglycan hydrolase FlgJ